MAEQVRADDLDRKCGLDQIAFRVESAARYVDVSRSKMYELLASGEVPSFRVGRAVRVRKEALDQWIQGQEERTSAA